MQLLLLTSIIGIKLSNLEVILKYGPYKTVEDIMKLHASSGLKSHDGTCIVLYNLRKYVFKEAVAKI